MQYRGFCVVDIYILVAYIISVQVMMGREMGSLGSRQEPELRSRTMVRGRGSKKLLGMVSVLILRADLSGPAYSSGDGYLK